METSKPESQGSGNFVRRHLIMRLDIELIHANAYIIKPLTN